MHVRSSQPVRVLALREGITEEREDLLAGEEPLEIRAAGRGQAPEAVAVTMRTPGDEEALAIGFLVSEGLVSARDAVGARFESGDPARMARPDDEITVCLPGPFDASRIAERHFVATASCGICGKASIDDVEARCGPLEPGPRVAVSVLLALPAAMRSSQRVFETTGGLHAAAAADPTGAITVVAEDVGRHNAVDKVIGRLALDGRLPFDAGLLLVSGRVSFEIVQKAAMAGIPFVAAVSAPTDLAVATAERLGMTLVGFLRDARLTIYSGTERVDLDA